MPERKVILNPISIRLSKEEKDKLDILQKNSNSKTQRELIVKMMDSYERTCNSSTDDKPSDYTYSLNSTAIEENSFRISLPYFNKLAKKNSVYHKRNSFLEFNARLIYCPNVTQLVNLSYLSDDSLNSLCDILNLPSDLDLNKYCLENFFVAYAITDKSNVFLNKNNIDAKKFLIIETINIHKIIPELNVISSNLAYPRNIIKKDTNLNTDIETLTAKYYFVDSFDEFMKKHFKKYMNISDCNFIESYISFLF